MIRSITWLTEKLEAAGKTELLELVAHMSDDDIWALARGGHDPQKVYAAYQQAVNTSGRPTVILAKTVKGFGMGEAGEGQNTTHQQKSMDLDSLKKSLGAIASDQYKSGGMSQSMELLLSTDPTLYLAAAGSLETITKKKSLQLRKYTLAKQRLTAT